MGSATRGIGILPVSPGFGIAPMNITCIQCHKPFSITAEQLGTRGKCPHCLATVILPKSAKSAAATGYQPLEPPSTWMQNTLSGVGAIILHLLVLVVIAMIPWGEFSDGSTGEGTQIMIGQLPQETLVNHPDEALEQVEIENPAELHSSDALEAEMFSPAISGTLAEQELASPLFSPSNGGQNPLEVKSLEESSAMAGGSEDFGNLISRLKRDGLDMVITFDSTGSMQGEIDQVKSQIGRIGAVLFKMIPKTRISICTYRDHGDSYIVKGLPLTDSIDEVVLYLQQISASGGGDEPEAVDEGLSWSIEKNNFRRQARKVILLFGDAPPHPDKSVRCQKLASDFRKTGGMVSTVTCRNDQRLQEFIAIAQIGRGEAFLTRNQREIMTQLMVLVFGSQHRSKVLEAFDLLTQ